MRDLKSCRIADGIAPTLQAVLDDWHFYVREWPHGMAPLARAYQLVCGTDNVYFMEGQPLRLDRPLMTPVRQRRLARTDDDIVLAHDE